MTLGNRLAHLREKEGISQERLGELLGVTRQTVSSWETDKLLPKPENLRALCRCFRVEYDYFFPKGEETRSKQVQELAAAVMALQGQVSALQEAQGEQQKAEAADQDPGKAGNSHRAIAVLFAVIAAVLIAVGVLIGVLYQEDEGDIGGNIVVFNMPSWSIAVIVGFFAAAVVAACSAGIVYLVRVSKAKGRKKEQTDKNK